MSREHAVREREQGEEHEEATKQNRGLCRVNIAHQLPRFDELPRVRVEKPEDAGLQKDRRKNRRSAES